MRPLYVGRCCLSQNRHFCLQGENGLPFPCVLLPPPSVTITQAHIYNIYANVPALAVFIPHALRVTLPLSLRQVVSNISINPPKGNGNASPLKPGANIRPLFGIYGGKEKKLSKINILGIFLWIFQIFLYAGMRIPIVG